MALGRATGTPGDPVHIVDETKNGVDQHGRPEGHPDWGRPLYLHGPVVKRFIAAYIILAFACTLGLFEGWRANRSVCYSSIENRAVLRTVLTRAAAASELNPDTSEAQKNRAANFYRDVLKSVPPIHC